MTHLDEHLEREADRLRQTALARWRESGPGSLGDLDLRAAAQQAQIEGDTATERRIDSDLASRGAR